MMLCDPRYDLNDPVNIQEFNHFLEDYSLQEQQLWVKIRRIIGHESVIEIMHRIKYAK